jgi:hypothetical protein
VQLLIEKSQEIELLDKHRRDVEFSREKLRKVLEEKSHELTVRQEEIDNLRVSFNCFALCLFVLAPNHV